MRSVRLEDAAAQTVVVDHPVVGNMAFEMKVKGQNVLRFPVRVDRGLQGQRRRRLQRDSVSRAVGQPAGRAGVLRQRQALAFDMELGNVRGAIPIHGFLTTTTVAGRRSEGGRGAAWVTSRLEFFRQPAWMKQFPFAHTIEMTYRLQDGVLQVTTKIAQPERRADAGGDRLPSVFSADRFARATTGPSRSARSRSGCWRRTRFRPARREPIEKLFPDPRAIRAEGLRSGSRLRRSRARRPTAER